MQQEFNGGINYFWSCTTCLGPFQSSKLIYAPLWRAHRLTLASSFRQTGGEMRPVLKHVQTLQAARWRVYPFFFCQGLPARPLCQTDVLPKQEDGDKERKKKEREGMEKVKTELRRIDFHHLALPYCLDSSSDYQWMILKINAEANKRLTDGRFAKGSYLHAAMLQSLTLLE